MFALCSLFIVLCLSSLLVVDLCFVLAFVWPLCVFIVHCPLFIVHYLSSLLVVLVFVFVLVLRLSESESLCLPLCLPF